MALLTNPQDFISRLAPTPVNPVVQQAGVQAARNVNRSGGLLSKAGLSLDPGAATRASSMARNRKLLSLIPRAAQTAIPLRERQIKLQNQANSINTTSPDAAFLEGFLDSPGAAEKGLEALFTLGKGLFSL